MLPTLTPLFTDETVATGRLKDLLRQAGLKATEARLAVLSQLLLDDKPVSHPELTRRLQEESPAQAKNIDRATIYRNLMDLVEKGLIERVHYGDRVWRFRFHTHASTEATLPHAHLSQQQHPHFVCQTCQSVVCLPASQAINEAWTNYSNQIQSVGKIKEVLLKGLCLNCD